MEKWFYEFTRDRSNWDTLGIILYLAMLLPLGLFYKDIATFWFWMNWSLPAAAFTGLCYALLAQGFLLLWDEIGEVLF